MRTMMKKCGVFAALAVVLLVTAALVTGCPASAPESSGYKPPAGMGAVKLNFSNTIERTALPDTARDLTAFEGGFQIQFTPTTGGASKSPVNLAAVSSVTNPLTAPIELTTGTYTLDVIAYLGPSAQANPAASFQKTGVVVAASPTPTDVVVVLKAIATGMGTGTFDWNITNNATGLTSATMTLTPLATGTAGTPVVFNVGQTTWADSDATLTVGYYYVDFVLVKSGVTINFRHILHIYQNTTSEFTYLFDNDHFVILQGYIGSSSWTYVDPLTEEIPLVLEVDSSGVASGDTVTVDKGAGASDPDTIVITVANAAAYDSIVWRYKGVALAPATGLDTVTTAYDELTVDSSVTPFNVEGINQVSIIGTKNGVPYSAELLIEVLDTP